MTMCCLLIFIVVGFLASTDGRTLRCDGAPDHAICHLRSDPSSDVSGIVGTVLFTHTKQCSADATFVQVHVNITGLPPFTNHRTFRRHGFHIHEFGSLTNGCRSMGGHYNPFNAPHGSPSDLASQRHVGDLGNVICDVRGNVRMDYYAPAPVTLRGERTIIGRGIVLHEGRDDLGRGGNEGSVRTGNAGSRLACCIIEPFE